MEPPSPLRTDALLASAAFRRWYRLGLAIKGVDGCLESIGGAVLLLIAPTRLEGLLALVVAREISNHPDDWIGAAVTRFAHAVSVDTQRFASLYLLGHGLVKVLLVTALWRERVWAFPIALWFMGAFLIYQIYRIAHTHSLALSIFSLLDVFVLWVIWRDWQRLRGGPRVTVPDESGASRRHR